MDFDETRLYYSHQQLQTRTAEDPDDEDVAGPVVDDEDDAANLDLKAARRHFREFLRT